MLNACDGITLAVTRRGDAWRYTVDLGNVQLREDFDDWADCCWAGLLAFYAVHATLPHRCQWAPPVRRWIAEHGNQSSSWCV